MEPAAKSDPSVAPWLRSCRHLNALMQAAQTYVRPVELGHERTHSYGDSSISGRDRLARRNTSDPDRSLIGRIFQSGTKDLEPGLQIAAPVRDWTAGRFGMRLSD